MLMPRVVAWMFSVGMMVLGWAVVSGQTYPSKPIRIVTGSPGSNSDFISRLIAQGLGGTFGLQVIVDNRPSGVIIGEIVAKAPPDAYTLLIMGSSFWLALFLQEKLPYDPVRDFSPIILATSSPNIIVVHPSLPVKTVKELIALAKARRGELDYASGVPGATSHLAAELFKAMAGVKIMRIPYKGSGQAINDLIGGDVQLMFPAAGAVVQHVKSGRLKALAVTSAQSSALVPGLPTVAASGLPGYEFASITGMFAPAKTPGTFINRLNEETVRVLNKEEIKERFFRVGIEIVGGSPEQFAATVKSEMARLGKVIKDEGIRAD